MKHKLTLDYTIPTGTLTPYFDALQDGKALASACTACGVVAFPARTLCGACGEKDMKWSPLKGTARILFRTDNCADESTDKSKVSFALVEFDGADTASTVALKNPEYKSTSGTLVAPKEGTSGLWLMLDETKIGENDGR